MTVYDMVYEDDQNDLYNILLNPTTVVDPVQAGIDRNQVTFSCYIKRGTADYRSEISYELVQFNGYFSKYGVDFRGIFKVMVKFIF